MGETRRAVMCYVVCGDRTLMIDRNKSEDDFLYGTYVALGGGIENGERPVDAVHRELWEEGKASVFNVRYRGTVLFKHLKEAANAGNMKNHSVDMFSTSLFYRHKNPMWECESGSLVWTLNSDIARLSSWNGGDVVFDWLKDGRIFDGEIVHGADKMESSRVAWMSKYAVADNPYRVD